MVDAAAILAHLKAVGQPEDLEAMAKFGLTGSERYAVRVPELRRMAKEIGTNHALAADLWATGVQEGRMLATMIDDPAQVTEAQMEAWAADFDAWDVCDQCCVNLFRRTPYAYEKAVAWSMRDETFVKRAGFTLMAALAIHDKTAPDGAFLPFLPLIQRESTDERNFVKKAVNWALRQIGKRNAALNAAAITTAESIRTLDSKAARWVAADALRELTSEKVRARLG